ncbi:copper amine oxidase N-terminal domain-containing protein [Paenibacillus fonticola]|uniref:copper amine oxidase N-terminal domain-containing protein n=1 Tax=Paenibacillus fonticola TaxID=379896 RepID=UPI00037139D1|nr:copper amine oxidase N-terminal domain-containing protein [Paenibacillus fonticola]
MLFNSHPFIFVFLPIVFIVYFALNRMRWIMAGKTFNLDLYKDLSHHSQDVNSWIAQAIGSDSSKYRMTDNNIAELNDQLVEDTVTATLDEQGNVTRVIVHINGRKHTFTQKIIDGKQQFLVYVKEAAAVFGGEAIWDEGTKATILKAKGKKDISITAGSTQAVVGDQLIDMNSTPLSMNGKTMIPFAFVAEQWGWQVKQEMGKNAVRLNVQER